MKDSKVLKQYDGELGTLYVTSEYKLNEFMKKNKTAEAKWVFTTEINIIKGKLIQLHVGVFRLLSGGHGNKIIRNR